ncbi:S41 family peptidase [Candidatus Endowatersipora endosymbiont of Watersipora subatra]|uniref:S41 family peptidase n=1 Tax=Candidatus Endowatersipora endosymbiont of Watersipora subatra TaxID=3077946 RepID=UPI00312CB7E7
MIHRLPRLCMGAMIGALIVASAQKDDKPSIQAGTIGVNNLDVLSDIFERIRSQYVREPEEKKLIKGAIDGMLQALDPHSSYLDAQERNTMRAQNSGKFGGLGIKVMMENDLIKVIAPISNTPASEAGLLAGDIISRINGEHVRDLSLQQAVEKMRGPVNTPIELTIFRVGIDKPIIVKIIRDIITIRSVKYRIEGNDVGYLDINRFTEQTYPGLKEAIETIRVKIPDKILKGYVIDLRLNPGGLLQQAISVSDAFLNHGEIVSTRGRDKTHFAQESAQLGDLTHGKPIIVLINGGSASASEIVAGALQDHHRATVLGTRSFGKGSVQTIIPLKSNGALRLTTALYYTPSGCSIQGKGIDPDIIVQQPLPKELQGVMVEKGESSLPNSIEGEFQDESGSGSIAYVPKDPNDDLQLRYALDLLRNIKKDSTFPPSPSGTNLENKKSCQQI